METNVAVTTPVKKRKPSKGPWLRSLGFDSSRYSPSSGYWYVGCSQCQAVCINGVPCHEHGCPNARRDDD